MDRDGALVWGLNGVGVILALLCLFAPLTSILVVCALMPWVAVLLIWSTRGRWVASVDRPEKRPNIVLAIAAPAAGLAIKGTSICTFIDMAPILMLAAIVPVIWVLALFTMQRAKPPRSPISLAVLLLFAGEGYGVGAMALVDAVGDKAIAATYAPRILAKVPRQGRSDDVLVLAPWGSRRGGNEPVTYDLFNAVKVGGQVCIDVHSGRLALRWYEVRPCGTANEDEA